MSRSRVATLVAQLVFCALGASLDRGSPAVLRREDSRHLAEVPGETLVLHGHDGWAVVPGAERGENHKQMSALEDSAASATAIGARPRASDGTGFQMWCGAHWSDGCRSCPEKYGELWCNGDCEWAQGVCTFRSNLTWCGGHPADSCDQCVWDFNAQGRSFVGGEWCHGDCAWHEESSKCLAVTTAKKASRTCSGWSPDSGPFKGWGASCGLWGWHQEWCYVDNNFAGHGKELMKSSKQHANQSWAPCVDISYKDMGMGECLDADSNVYDRLTGGADSLDVCKDTCTSVTECIGFEYVWNNKECSVKFADLTLPTGGVGQLTEAFDGNVGTGDISGTTAQPDGGRQCFKKFQEPSAPKDVQSLLQDVEMAPPAPPGYGSADAANGSAATNPAPAPTPTTAISQDVNTGAQALGTGMENNTHLKLIVEHHLQGGDWRGKENPEHDIFVVMGVGMLLFFGFSVFTGLLLTVFSTFCGAPFDYGKGAQESAGAEGAPAPDAPVEAPAEGNSST